MPGSSGSIREHNAGFRPARLTSNMGVDLPEKNKNRTNLEDADSTRVSPNFHLQGIIPVSGKIVAGQDLAIGTHERNRGVLDFEEMEKKAACF